MILPWRDSPLLALVKRDIICNLRTVRAFVLLCLTMGGVTYAVGVMLRESGFGPGGASQALFGVFVSTLFAVAVVFVPPLAAVSICVERQKETFDSLLLTILRPRDIVLGKVLSTFGFYALILVALLPVAGVLFFLVGIVKVHNDTIVESITVRIVGVITLLKPTMISRSESFHTKWVQWNTMR